jgi:hypothetical protein
MAATIMCTRPPTQQNSRICSLLVFTPSRAARCGRTAPQQNSPAASGTKATRRKVRSQKDKVAWFRANRTAVERVASNKFDMGAFEKDGFISITHWRRRG